MIYGQILRKARRDVVVPLERFQNKFSHVVQHCYDTYLAKYAIGQTTSDWISDAMPLFLYMCHHLVVNLNELFRVC